MQTPTLDSFDRLPRLAAGSYLVDSHCHLDLGSLGSDSDDAVARAERAGIARMVTIGASGPFEANRQAIAIAERHPSVFATVGVHPHEASTVDDAVLQEIERLAAHPRVVGIGETGLDYHYDNSPRPRQRDAFARFLDIARRLALPVSIHLREADADAAAIIADVGLPPAGGVIHCFSGDATSARIFLDMGLHISFSGIVTFRTGEPIREAARLVPADRLLIETDAPFLAPVPFRGRRNEPALLLATAEVVAAVRGELLDDVAATTSANAIRLFRLTQPRA